jgi:hypothetical protein
MRAIRPPRTVTTIDAIRSGTPNLRFIQSPDQRTETRGVGAVAQLDDA